MPITKILIVEDNPGDTRILRECLREVADAEFELEECQTVLTATELLCTTTPDVILCDLALPDSEGLESVRSIHRSSPEVPLVIVTCSNDEALAIRSLHEGAQDYLFKGQINADSLWRSVRYAMERQRVHLQLFSDALSDDLTGLNNRRGFSRLAEHHVRLAYRTQKPFLLAFIDLDGLKGINDTYGHQEGNRALVEASSVIRDSFRQSDILGRIGGDEFVVLITDADKDSIETVYTRVQDKLTSLNKACRRHYEIALSIGIVHADPARMIDLDALLSQADALMYEHKLSKRLARAD